jgi:hypothetical protein
MNLLLLAEVIFLLQEHPTAALVRCAAAVHDLSVGECSARGDTTACELQHRLTGKPVGFLSAKWDTLNHAFLTLAVTGSKPLEWGGILRFDDASGLVKVAGVDSPYACAVGLSSDGRAVVRVEPILTLE